MMKAQNAQPRPYTYEDVIDVDREFADFVESVSLSKEELAAFVDMPEFSSVAEFKAYRRRARGKVYARRAEKFSAAFREDITNAVSTGRSPGHAQSGTRAETDIRVSPSAAKR
jgi:hypothetical protein